MAIERVRRVGAYAPLSSTYYQDDAIADAGEAAELLFLRGLAFCASRPEQDGYISRTQVVRFAGVGMPDALERAARLVDVGLWEEAENGFQVRSWLRWNKSADELGRYRAKDRERKRKPSTPPPASPPDGTSDDASDGEPEDRAESGEPSDIASARNPSGRRADSETASDTHITTQHSTTRKEHPPNPPRGERGSRRANNYDDPAFTRFWNAYPLKTGKPSAWKAWRAALKRGADPEAIIQAAIRYRDDPARKPDFTKHPGPWLNDERYNDPAAATASATTGSWWDN